MNGNPPRSGNNTAPVIATVNCKKNTGIVARSPLIQIDSGASLECGDPTTVAAMLDYVPARHEVSTYIMSMVRSHSGINTFGLP